MISAWERAEAAGTSAYDEVYAAAIRSGKGQEEAIAAATEAQKAASAEVLKIEGQKLARMAAFEAALAAIRSGNAEGAVEAARKAAKETSDAWDTAVGVVGEAWDATSEAVKEDAKGLGETIDTAFRDRAFTVTQHLRTTGQHNNPNEYEERQHGGPVSGGRPYIVGEAGPELFIPRQSGSIAPGGGSSKQLADEIGQAVARAVQHGINVVIPPDQITDAVLRRTPSRVALRGSGG